MRVCTLLFSVIFFLAATPENRAAKYILRDELNIEKQRLLNIDEELNQLRRQRRTLQREISITIADQIRENTAEIQNQTDLLQSQRTREAAIDRSAEAYLTQITAASRANQEQLEYSIQDIQRERRQLPQNRSNELSAQLENLREQRRHSAALQLEQIQALNNDRAYQKNQLSEDLSTLQNSISTLRSENARLESERVRAQRNLNFVEQQLTEQQKILNDY